MLVEQKREISGGSGESGGSGTTPDVKGPQSVHENPKTVFQSQAISD
jgi:hypothetical protein